MFNKYPFSSSYPQCYRGETSILRGYSSKQLDRKLGSQSMVNLRARLVTRGLTKSKLDSWIKVSVIYRKFGKIYFVLI